MKFSVCVDQIFRDFDLYESLERLGTAGIRDIEFTFWADKDFERLLELREKYNFRYLGICPQPGGSMADPSRRDEYLKYLEDAVKAAKKLGCKSVTLQSGDRTEAVSAGMQYDNMMELLRQGLEMVKGTELMILLEPRNYYAAPNTFLGSSDMGFEMVRSLESPQLRLLYDIYHMQLNEGDIINRIRNNLPLVGHIHAAGIENRSELQYGELNYDYIFHALEKMHYTGYVGLEYFPSEADPIPELKKVITNKTFYN